MATKGFKPLKAIPGWVWLIAGGIGFYLYVWPKIDAKPLQPYLGAIYPAQPQGSILPPGARMQGSDALISSPLTTRRS